MPVHRMISELDVIELIQIHGNFQEDFILLDAIEELAKNGLQSAIAVLSGEKQREAQ